MCIRTWLTGVGVFTIALMLMGPGARPAAGATQNVQDTARKAGNVITDSWITMKIHAQFVPEKALDDSDIKVETKDGMVTLSGTVASAGGRTRAVAIAKATDGVKGVTDNLTVAAYPVGGVSDGWIKSRIYGQFITEKALDNSNINVDVDKGVVTLKGTVRSEAGRTRAMAIAKATNGVKNVNDALMISAGSY